MDVDTIPQRLEVRLLGPFEIRADGATIPLKPQALRLLALLAINANQPVSRATITEAVWDGGVPDVKDTANQVQVHVRAIRKALSRGGLPADAVEFTGSGRYKLHSPPVHTDLDRFRRKVATAEAAVSAGHLPQASEALAEALRIGQGTALDGMDGQFAEAESIRLEELKLKTLLDRIDIDLWDGRHEDLAPELAALTWRRRTDDRFRMRLMIALHASARSPEALEAFRAGRQIAKEDLGLEPGRALQAVHQAIIEGARATELLAHVQLSSEIGAAPHREAPEIPPNRLPAEVRNFTGRASELQKLDQLLGTEQPDSIMVVSVISGAAGVGKTALAVAWAQRRSNEFPDGLLHLDLHGYSPDQPLGPAEGMSPLLETLGVTPEQIPGSADAQAMLYRSKLAGKRMLILLDNANSADQVRPLLPGAGACVVLVTSRSALGGLVARDGARRIDIGPLPASESIVLLSEIIGLPRIAAEQRAAAEVADSCGHLPLALRIAAERVAARSGVTLSALASELASERDRLDVLATPGGDPATSVRLVFSWSYRTLDTSAQRAFRLLSLASGPDIGIPAAAALCQMAPASVRGILDELSSEHLLDEVSYGRYRCHDLLRVYADERAENDELAGERDAAVRSMLTWYLYTSDAADQILLPRKLHVPLGPASEFPAPLKFSTPAQALAWCRTEKANLTAAVRDAAERGFHTIAWKLAATMWGYFYLQKPLADWKATYEIGLKSARKASDLHGEALMLFGLGTANWSTEECELAIEKYKEALPVWRHIGHKLGEAMTLNNLGAAHAKLEQFDDALSHLHSALQIRHSIGDERGQAQTMTNIGEVMLDSGDARSAYRQTQAALRLSERIRYRYGEAEASYVLAMSAMSLGRHVPALPRLGRSLELRREFGDRQGEAEALATLGEAQLAAGSEAAARQSWEQALAIFEQLDGPKAADIRGRLGQPRQQP
jgi:DNA-binding SARP family transcriptional activator/tetratricopeptide (TPR) repeat protein